MIDKEPKVLKKITLEHILLALKVISTNEVQMIDKREYGSVKKSWTLKNGLFLFDRTIISVSVVSSGKRTQYYFFNENYKDFYKKHKYSVSDSSSEMGKVLNEWQEKESKNCQKYISKMVNQFDKTQSLQISIRLLNALPKLTFGDTETFSSPLELSPISCSLKDEQKEKKANEIAKAKALVKNLQSSLLKAEENLEYLMKGIK